MKSNRISSASLYQREATSRFIPIAIPLIPITTAAIALLSLLTFTLILPSTNKGKADGSAVLGSTDTGKATLSSVTLDVSNKVPSPDKTERITEVTVAGTKLTEGIDDDTASPTYGYHKILNNNTVLYNINYTVNTPGTITIVFTLPANNTIDSASIATTAGCLTGSKLQKATVDGKPSATNNQAICIANATNTSYSLAIKAYPWGGNNEQITPTIELGDQSLSPTNQPTKSKDNTVVVMGKAEYCILYGWQDKASIEGDYNASIKSTIDVYYHPSCRLDVDSVEYLGIEPKMTMDW